MSEEKRGDEAQNPELLLLPSKLNPPVASPFLVPRVRLNEWLQPTPSLKLVLVEAPAGFGKTTAMLQWFTRLRQEGRHAAWLTLDETDNDAVRFVAYLGEALRSVDPSFDIGVIGGPDLDARTVFVGLLSNLLHWLTTSKVPFTLFVDDFETIRNPEIHDVVRQILEHLPPERRLVIATRENPELSVGRMRARRQLVEIGVDQLRFAWEETERFLRQEGNLALDDADVERLQQCTEGWVTGLQLAALALVSRGDRIRKTFIRSFSGSFRDIADYLAEDVLSRQPEDVRDFLLETSILERLSGPLCDRLTGRTDSFGMLGYLERANLFLAPLDDERRWYRYHNVFAQFLRSRLERVFSDRVPALHRGAATWFSENGCLVEAAEHALAAGDAQQAAGFITQCAQGLVSTGQVSTLADWVARLPADALDRHPGLRLAYAWSLAFLLSYEKAGAVLDQICRGAEGKGKPLEPATRIEVNTVRAILLAATDKTEEARRLVAETLSELPRPGTFVHGSLSNLLGYCVMVVDRFEEASDLYRQARRSHTEAGSVFGVVYSDCFDGVAQFAQGRLRAALALYRSAVTRAREATPGHSIPGVLATAFLAEALYERNEIEEAEKLLSTDRARLKECGPVDGMLVGYRTLGRIFLRQGKPEEAERLLDEAEELGIEQGAARVPPTIRLERIRLSLERGDVDAAERIAAKTDDTDLWRSYEGRCLPANDPETLELSHLRLMVERGQVSEALPCLKTALAKAEIVGRQRRALAIRILEAAALDARGDRKAALRVLAEAVRFGRAEGYVRSFADGGPRVAGMIHELHEAGSGEERAYLDEILAATGATRPQPSLPEPRAERALAEDLTAREIQILELAAQGLSNRELAARLFVSEHTVKFHLANINSKLAAKSRTQAIAKARQLGLIG